MLVTRCVVFGFQLPRRPVPPTFSQRPSDSRHTSPDQRRPPVGREAKPNDDGVENAGQVDDGKKAKTKDEHVKQSEAETSYLVVDWDECISCGTCIDAALEVFALTVRDNKAVVLTQEAPEEVVQDAIDACPVACIFWTDEPQRYPMSDGRAD